MIDKIISGGQTGVDRAALDVALALKIPQGGWCPKGRLSEDGIIPQHHQLQETPSSKYSERTEWNVRDADGTLIILHSEPIGGTLLTINLAERLKKPLLIFDLSNNQGNTKILIWLLKNKIKILNIAGPRESQEPGIYQSAYDLLFQNFLNLLRRSGC